MKLKPWMILLLAYISSFIFMLLLVWFLSYQNDQLNYSGFKRALNDFGFTLSIIMIWLYYLLFIWLASLVGFITSYIKKLVLLSRVFGAFLVITSVLLLMAVFS